MSVVLARRLVSEGLVPAEHVNAALLTHVTERTAFLEALVRAHPTLIGRLEAELGSARAVETVKADPALMSLVPPGLWATLLAVPVGRDAGTRIVRIVAVDPSDPHLTSELSHQLGGTVRVTGASLGAILAALGLRPPRTNGRPVEPPAADPLRPSEPPIPLVRVTAEAVPVPHTVKGVAPQASGAAHASRVVVPPRAMTVPSEPVIELTRAKQPSVILRRVDIDAEGASSDAAVAAPAPAPAPAPQRVLEPGERETAAVDAASHDFDAATTADEVVAALVRSLVRVASRVVVLAARGKVFEGRDTSDPERLKDVRKLVISGDRPSVLVSATQNGTYIGPMPQTLVHEQLARVLDDPEDDIVVGAITVSGRPALLYVLARTETTYLATRVAERIAKVAAQALERVVRQRKR